jgi:hypothetical protein
MKTLVALWIGLSLGGAPTDAATCRQSGGTWREPGGRGAPGGCWKATRDGDKACTDSSQCEEACVRGKCAGHTLYRGCGILDHGKTICRD